MYIYVYLHQQQVLFTVYGIPGSCTAAPTVVTTQTPIISRQFHQIAASLPLTYLQTLCYITQLHNTNK